MFGCYVARALKWAGASAPAHLLALAPSHYPTPSDNLSPNSKPGGKPKAKCAAAKMKKMSLGVDLGVSQPFPNQLLYLQPPQSTPSVTKSAASLLLQISASSPSFRAFILLIDVWSPRPSKFMLHASESANYSKPGVLKAQTPGSFMVSRGSRWLQTVLVATKGKSASVSNTFLVMRHSAHASSTPKDTHPAPSAIYYPNDIVAPSDISVYQASRPSRPSSSSLLSYSTLKDCTLDETCTVTSPGFALIAAAIAVKELASVLQHLQWILAPAPPAQLPIIR
ncbi:hypothetical protein K443DRAFT_13469 [Laccaria amethystina LaAM-08-1]|uniref:Uncharacterized protein n=1 Tax=Laccaria amethystina LaAM-08-1 TaxID=1095629 RepID=A0A0C9WIA8_9AGAR|nr:hypothetical protein K443DRAFT_13469 [Laccaria amethystina LaAM-08-1]